MSSRLCEGGHSELIEVPLNRSALKGWLVNPISPDSMALHAGYMGYRMALYPSRRVVEDTYFFMVTLRDRSPTEFNSVDRVR